MDVSAVVQSNFRLFAKPLGAELSWERVSLPSVDEAPTTHLSQTL